MAAPRVLTGDYETWVGSWEPSALPPGQKLQQPRRCSRSSTRARRRRGARADGSSRRDRVIDTHAHLDACDEPASVARRSARATPASASRRDRTGHRVVPRGARAADAHEGVFAALGVHPHQAGEPEAERVDELARAARAPNARRGGRDGPRLLPRLAPATGSASSSTRSSSSPPSSASRSSIHCRAADAETRGVARATSPARSSCTASRPRRSSAGSRARLLRLVRRQRHLPERGSCARRPPACRPTAPRRDRQPLPRPQPVRGRPNEPANVVHTIAALAEARGVGKPASLAARSTPMRRPRFGLP